MDNQEKNENEMNTTEQMPSPTPEQIQARFSYLIASNMIDQLFLEFESTDPEWLRLQNAYELYKQNVRLGLIYPSDAMAKLGEITVPLIALNRPDNIYPRGEVPKTYDRDYFIKLPRTSSGLNDRLDLISSFCVNKDDPRFVPAITDMALGLSGITRDDEWSIRWDKLKTLNDYKGPQAKEKAFALANEIFNLLYNGELDNIIANPDYRIIQD